MFNSLPAQVEHALELKDSVGGEGGHKVGYSAFSDYYSFNWFTTLGFVNDDGPTPTMVSGFDAMVGMNEEVNWGAAIGQYASDEDGSLEDLDMEIQALEHTL